MRLDDSLLLFLRGKIIKKMCCYMLAPEFFGNTKAADKNMPIAYFQFVIRFLFIG